MNHIKKPSPFSSLPSVLAGAMVFSALGCNAGVELRPKLPSFEARAELGGSPAAPATYQPASQAAPYSAMPPAEVAPAGVASSGGGTMESAEAAAIGTSVAGRVSAGAPRYYYVDLEVGDSLSFKVYQRKLQEATHFSAALLEPDGVRLGGANNYLAAPVTEFERDQFAVTVKQAGRHYILVSAKSQPVEYRVDIASVNMAAR